MEDNRTNRERLSERMKSRYQDDEYDDDDELLYGRANEMADELDGLQQQNEDIYGFLKDNPELGAVLAAVKRGEHPMVAMRRYFDEEDFNMTEDDPNYQDWMEAGESRKKAKEERARLLEELEANGSISQKNIEEYARENGLSEEEMEELLASFRGDLDEIGKGLISKDYLGRMRKAYSHDDDVANALAAGQVKGRNEQIDSRFRSGGDGLPNYMSSPRGAEDDEMDESTRSLSNLNRKINEDSKWGNSGYKKVR